MQPFLTLTPNTVVVSCDCGLVQATVDGEVMALDIDTSVCYGLNKVGSRIWTLLAKPVCISDLCAVLTAEYAVDQDVCERQVMELLEELLTEGLIKIPNSKE